MAGELARGVPAAARDDQRGRWRQRRRRTSELAARLADNMAGAYAAGAKPIVHAETAPSRLLEVAQAGPATWWRWCWRSLEAAVPWPICVARIVAIADRHACAVWPAGKPAPEIQAQTRLRGPSDRFWTPGPPPGLTRLALTAARRRAWGLHFLQADADAPGTAPEETSSTALLRRKSPMPPRRPCCWPLLGKGPGAC